MKTWKGNEWIISYILSFTTTITRQVTYFVLCLKKSAKEERKSLCVDVRFNRLSLPFYYYHNSDSNVPRSENKHSLIHCLTDQLFSTTVWINIIFTLHVIYIINYFIQLNTTISNSQQRQKIAWNDRSLKKPRVNVWILSKSKGDGFGFEIMGNLK